MLLSVEPVVDGAAGCIRPDPVESKARQKRSRSYVFFSASGRIGRVPIGDRFRVLTERVNLAAVGTGWSHARKERMKRAINILSVLLVLGAGGAAMGGESSFSFTVTADPRDKHALFGATLAEINALVGGPGAFHVSPGDIDGDIGDNRAEIDTHFGTGALWYPGVGNHEASTSGDMQWLRDEYNIGNNGRAPLSTFTNQDGPIGSKETTYSWDFGNAHFIQLNEYWDGSTNVGADMATDGDVVPALRAWLAADLAANTKPYVFVFGHEPAFPQNRHLGSSLNAYPDNRDAFWQLMEEYDVHAYFTGHSHFYSSRQGNRTGEGSVWQIDAGAAGNGEVEVEGDPTVETFINVTVTDTEVTYDVYDNSTGAWAKLEGWSAPKIDPTPPPDLAPLIASCHFDEPPEGTQNWTPGPGDKDLGFQTTIIAGTPDYLATYDSDTSPWRYRMRTIEAVVEMDTVDLSEKTGVTVGIDVSIKDTEWESDDYFLVTVTNGVDTIDVAREEGTLDGLAKETWIHYEVDIPDDWTEATLSFSSHTNSSSHAEAIDFDYIEFRGIPEPATITLLALGALAVLHKRRKQQQ